jgi:hypothetical protein
MGKIFAFCSPVSRPPPQKDFLRKRLFRLLDSSRENPFVWVCGPAGFRIIAIFSCYIESKGSQCHWHQFEGGYRCIKTHIYNIGITAVIPTQDKSKLFPTLSPEYQFDHHVFTQLFFKDYYSRLKVLPILVFDILQDTLPVANLH